MPDLYLEEHQSRRRDPSPYESKLAHAIEEVFGSGAHDLAGLAAGLAEMGVTTRAGAPMSEQALLEEIRELEAAA